MLAAGLSSSAMAQGWWDGPEIGVQGGYAWGTSKGSIPAIPLTYKFDPSGGLGGAHAGYNWQWDHVVLGIEGDAEGADVNGSLTGNFPTVRPIFRGTAKTNMDFDASIRGKLGYAFDRVLVYGTGGVAFGDVKTTFTAVGPDTVGSTSDVRVGWTAGGGLAYAHHAELGTGRRISLHRSRQQERIVPARGYQRQQQFNFSAVRAVLTYRFAPPPPPPPMAAPMPAAAPAPAPAMARTFLVFFDFDKYNLTPDARRVIEAAAQSYKATGSARIDVSGYTDLAGTQAYNLRLSQRRADAVAGYLMKQGVPKNVMDVKWFGKEHPRVPTPDGVREPQNRRVEIVMP